MRRLALYIGIAILVFIVMTIIAMPILLFLVSKKLKFKSIVVRQFIIEERDHNSSLMIILMGVNLILGISLILGLPFLIFSFSDSFTGYSRLLIAFLITDFLSKSFGKVLD
ncbi:hypothetical protein P8891_06475 [Bacillus atrophaeus]|uniref:hypothetical protein n=1 Tax=Bacillus atrophaeus TaxID=1452 RepID=UPI00227E2DB4|nr:hypothetical protein [Bacillus atrophaeus]MCY7947974.1 hypothetical protein [Bacillus atrophaeus]MCY8098227.1 hypothetical protein [Bacillus atrophaeus]MCY9170004.1 hypothetical protein [Bacillus atrophaeus]MEC0740730.1 hypothetical protein [Bacillus atrophaeus]MEC0747007.1 hypothetical protein [Bacillus atrophaeus]